jgi:hypothetical protein
VWKILGYGEDNNKIDMYGGQPSIVPYYPLRRKKGHHSQGNMVGGNMGKLGKLAGESCYTWCYVVENG